MKSRGSIWAWMVVGAVGFLAGGCATEAAPGPVETVDQGSLVSTESAGHTTENSGWTLFRPCENRSQCGAGEQCLYAICFPACTNSCPMGYSCDQGQCVPQEQPNCPGACFHQH
jgi:hypothetical protein